jgi:hypothetical protein
MTAPSISYLNYLHYRAKQLGYRLFRSNWRRDYFGRVGSEYQLINVRLNIPVLGSRFDADLEQIASFLEEEEKRQA